MILNMVVNREMLVKTTIRYFTPTRIAIITKTENNKCCKGGEESGNLVHCWQEYKMVQPLWT